MENQNHYFRVGLFIITVISIMLFFTLRFYGLKKEVYNDYAILFQNDIGGLGVGSVVTLQGINVGSVKDIGLFNDEVTVKVIIQVKDQFVIREDTVASLRITGVSGAVKVQLENRGFSEEKLVANDFQDYPLIPSDSSTFEQIFNDLPQVMGSIKKAMTQIEGFISDQNIAATSNIIRNFEKLSDTLGNRSDDIDKMFDQFQTSLNSFEEAMDDLPKITKNLDETLTQSNQLINGSLKQTLEQAKTTLSQSSSAISQLENMISDGRTSLEVLSKLGSQISDHPTSIIKEPRYKGYKIVE